MKIINFLIMFLFIKSLVYAQLVTDYGIKFGLVSAKIQNDINTQNYSIELMKKNRIGPTFSIFLHYFDKKFLNFETELNYLQKGAEDKFEVTTVEKPDGTGEKYAIDYQLDYLQINLNIQPKYVLNQVVLYGILGPSLSILLGTKGIFAFIGAEDYNLGYSLGFGFRMNNIGNKSILIEVIQNIDLNNFYESEYYKLKNKLWKFRIGISLN